MKEMKILTYLILIAFTSSCANKTSTPKEFNNNNKVTKKAYENDLVLLTDVIKAHYDSINSVINPSTVPKLLGVKIDTLFYSNDNKIVFLGLFTRENEHAEKGIQYAGECFIAYKKDNVEDLYKLKYSSTSTKSLEEVSEMIRMIYLREMNYIEGKYNINDNRFWESRVWHEAKKMKEKRKSFEELKKTHPENVYDPKN
jgi:hypothetical protein